MVEKFSRLSRGDFSPATAGSDGETAGEKKDPANSESIERPVVIGSFIAVLELVKRGLLRVSQQNDRADIEIMLGMTSADEVESDSLTSEFDLTDSGDQKGSDQRGSELKGSAQGSAAQIVGTQNSAIVNSGAINADLESRKNSHNLSLANQRAA